MALDLRLHKDASDVSSGPSSLSQPSEDKQVTLNIPKVATTAEMTSAAALTATDLGSQLALAPLALSLGIPLDYTASLYSTALLDTTDIKPFTIQPISEAEETAVQRELNKIKDDWSKCRSEMTSPKQRRLDGSRGIGWTTIGDVIVPYIMRGPCKYVSTKIVECKLLQALQGVNLEKMSHAGPLYSYYITEQEARLFSEINSKCYSNQFGSDPFTTQDLIVSLNEFEQFYNNLRKQCGVIEAPKKVESKGPGRPKRSSLLTSMPHLIQDFNDTSAEGVEGGWVQINNTVVPYVFRNGVKYTPLCVIKYSAGLLNDVRIDGYKTPCTEMEYQYFNQTCRSLGLDFSFLKSTKLIKLELVIRLSSCKVTIKELPTEDPFSQATYQAHVRDPILAYPMSSSSPDLAPDQNPSLFQIPCPVNMAATAVDTFNLFTPVTAIASHALQFFNAAGTSSLLHCLSKDPNHIATTSPPNLASIASSIPNSAAMSSTYSSTNQSPPCTKPSMQSQSTIPKPASTTSSAIPSARILSDPTRKLPTFSKNKQRLMKPSHLVNKPVTPSPIIGQPNKIVIECVEFQGKTLPCLLRGGVPENSFVLVESVMRLFFPQTTLDKFIDILQGVMDVTIVYLRSVEEQAFIRFYNLPVKAMRYKYMMMFQELQRSFLDLKSYFSVGVLSKNAVPSDKPLSRYNMHASTSPVLSNDRTPPKVMEGEHVKLETGKSPVCYVMDNKVVSNSTDSPKDTQVVSQNDSKQDRCKSLMEEPVNDMKEERQALLLGYNSKQHEEKTDKSKECDISNDDTNNKAKLQDSCVDKDISNELISPAHESLDNSKIAETHPCDEDCKKQMRESAEEQDADVSSTSECDEANTCSDNEDELTTLDDTDSQDSSVIDISQQQRNDVDKENDCNYNMNKDDNVSLMDTNHNEEQQMNSEGVHKRRHDSGSDSCSPAITEKKMKTMNINKLESALAKLKQRQQEKLVAGDTDG